MKPAVALLLAASSAALVASLSRSRAGVEASPYEAWAGLSFNLDNLIDRTESIVNQVTETPATVPPDAAAQNVSAFLRVLRQAEGTERATDPYRVCYGYRHTASTFEDHPAVTGEWAGERLSDAMCANAGFGPGCVSTAAGAYQIIRPTWRSLKASLSLPDFSPASQDAAAIQLIRSRGALEDVKAGRFDDAVRKCKNEWASLPGNYAKQGQRSLAELSVWYQQNGGNFA